MKHPMIRLIIVVLFASTSFFGCTTFSRKQCETMDWRGEGFATALEGKFADSSLKYYQRECGKEHQIEPDQSLFNEGHASGMKRFCQPTFALQFGATGGDYRGNCPEEVEEKWLARYQVGKMDYLSKKVKTLEAQVVSLESEINSKESRILELESQLKNQ